MVGPNDEVDACAFCGDPLSCDGSCEVDRLRQEEVNAAIVRLAEAKVRKRHSTWESDAELEDMFDSYVNNQIKSYKEARWERQ